MFKNLIVYRIASGLDIDHAALSEGLGGEHDFAKVAA